jgi:hypothetical protein
MPLGPGPLDASTRSLDTPSHRRLGASHPEIPGAIHSIADSELATQLSGFPGWLAVDRADAVGAEVMPMA